MTFKLNGNLMQNGHTKEFVFNVQQIIAHVSSLFTLVPGDLIFTGTPAGVGFGKKPPLYLKHGDECVCEVEHLGILRNKVVDEPVSKL